MAVGVGAEANVAPLFISLLSQPTLLASGHNSACHSLLSSQSDVFNHENRRLLNSSDSGCFCTFPPGQYSIIAPNQEHGGGGKQLTAFQDHNHISVGTITGKTKQNLSSGPHSPALGQQLQVPGWQLPEVQRPQLTLFLPAGIKFLTPYSTCTGRAQRLWLGTACGRNRSFPGALEHCMGSFSSPVEETETLIPWPYPALGRVWAQRKRPPEASGNGLCPRSLRTGWVIRRHV